MAGLGGILPRSDAWKSGTRPDLTVWMGVRRPHRLTPVLEHLDPPVGPSEVRRLVSPQVHHAPDIADAHLGQGQVVARREAHDPTRARLAFGDEQTVLGSAGGRVGTQGSEVIGEDVGRVVRRVPGAIRPSRSGAQIARWVEVRAFDRDDRIAPALPRPARSLGRHEDPLVQERIVSPMWSRLAGGDVAHRDRAYGTGGVRR